MKRSEPIKIEMHDKGFMLKIPLDPDDYNMIQEIASSYGSITVYDHMLDVNDLSLKIVFKKKSNRAQKTSGAWKFACHNPSYSPFDCSPDSLYECTNCGYTTGSTTEYCPRCGSKNR